MAYLIVKLNRHIVCVYSRRNNGHGVRSFHIFLRIPLTFEYHDSLIIHPSSELCMSFHCCHWSDRWYRKSHQTSRVAHISILAHTTSLRRGARSLPCSTRSKSPSSQLIRRHHDAIRGQCSTLGNPVLRGRIVVAFPPSIS